MNSQCVLYTIILLHLMPDDFIHQEKNVSPLMQISNNCHNQLMLFKPIEALHPN